MQTAASITIVLVGLQVALAAEASTGGRRADSDDGNDGNEGNEGDKGKQGKSGRKARKAGRKTGGSRPPSRLKPSRPEPSSPPKPPPRSKPPSRPNFPPPMSRLLPPRLRRRCRRGRAAAQESGTAIAAALASSQASCVSTGDAFSCASAAATAEAWAAAAAEAHATAFAASAESCSCLADAQAVPVGSASTFIELMAQVSVRAEVSACSRGDQAVAANAYSSCSAAAYATVWTTAIPEALLEGGCYDSDADVVITAETRGAFTPPRAASATTSPLATPMAPPTAPLLTLLLVPSDGSGDARRAWELWHAWPWADMCETGMHTSCLPAACQPFSTGLRKSMRCVLQAYQWSGHVGLVQLRLLRSLWVVRLTTGW
eukprot:jgi/Ulvmu1/10181/UM006_0137.1